MQLYDGDTIQGMMDPRLEQGIYLWAGGDEGLTKMLLAVSYGA